MRRPPVDFIEAFAVPFSAHVMGESEAGREAIIPLFQAYAANGSAATSAGLVLATRFRSFLQSLFERGRRGQVAEGFISHLVQAGDGAVRSPERSVILLNVDPSKRSCSPTGCHWTVTR
ncbi:hypothetical protein ACGFNP_50585 [Nonomuraea sp. NPDC049269]|uniref:hypothetical protein n=1 Tax=Nonomuraea sp. NPDC049269 TaxID=3364349 RepID=UPI003714C230